MKPPSSFGRRRATPFDKPKGKSIASRIVNPMLEFARKGDMLTAEEYQACLLGNMAIKGGGGLPLELMNVNSEHPTLLTGQRTKISYGRATRIRVNRLLGLEDDAT